MFETRRLEAQHGKTAVPELLSVVLDNQTWIENDRVKTRSSRSFSSSPKGWKELSVV